MTKITLHIGCEKTGSTSVQNFLYANKENLKKRYGMLYPKSLGRANHTKIAIFSCNDDKKLTRFLSRNKSLNEFRAELESEFVREVRESGLSHVLISAEWLHPRVREEEEFERLKSLLTTVADDIEIVFYIRRQDKMAMSLYSTSLKAGNYRAFEFPEVSEKKHPYYYDFLSIYRNWVAQFGKTNVKLRIFDRRLLVDGDVVSDFMHVLGVSAENLQRVPEDNSSLSNTGILFIRLFNWLISFFGSRFDPVMVRKMRGRLVKPFIGKPRLASDNQAQSFYRYFSENNRILVFEYLENTGIDLLSENPKAL